MRVYECVHTCLYLHPFVCVRTCVHVYECVRACLYSQAFV